MKPLRKGRVLARCSLCGAQAVAKGDGGPVHMTHKPDCPERS